MEHFSEGKRSLRTGDALIFTSNTSTGFILRTLTSSKGNHAGIAVRIKDDGHVSIDGTGKLYVLEINTWERFDPVTGIKSAGAGYSDFDWVEKRYNIISARKLKDKYRIPKLAVLTEQFVKDHQDVLFTNKIGPFFSAWIGVPFHDAMEEEVPETRRLFCSEFMGHYYDQCVGSLLEEVDDISYTGNLVDILGDGGPSMAMFCSPHHFFYSSTPKSIIFEKKDEVVYVARADTGVVLIPVIIITFFVLAFINMSVS